MPVIAEAEWALIDVAGHEHVASQAEDGLDVTPETQLCALRVSVMAARE